MRILLAHKFHKLTGGAEVFYFEVGRVLEENGHEVAYFSTLDEETVENPYLKYFSKAPDFKSSGAIGKIKSFIKIPYNFESKRKFKSLVEDFKPDIIHAFGVITQISPSIFDVARDFNIPLVVSLNDYKHLCPNSKMFHHNRLCEDCKGGIFYKAIINKCSHDSYVYSIASSIESYVHSSLNIYKKNINLFLFASSFMANKTQEFWGEDSFKCGNLKNPFKISEKPLIENKGNYGLYFGRLSEEKGVDLILKALTKNKDIPFKIVGEGPLFDELYEFSQKKELYNVEFLGAMWGKDLEDILYNAKFVVVPSVWYENFPYVILQSFAAGVPVIASDIGGISELVSTERGMLFNPKNVESLIEIFNQIKSRLLIDLGLNARKYVVENFNDRVFYQDIIRNYNLVIK